MDLAPSHMITLMTDFGTSDHYVGVMKGVILNINPQVEIVDITHAIPPQDILGAAFLIDSTYRYFPSGTIHVVVVDPGVGSERRAIVCQTETAYFVCPDNGLLTHILHNEKHAHAVAVENSAYFLPQVSNTFHGRDIFAPVAAHLSRGVPISELGNPVTQPVQLALPKPQVTEEMVIGHIIWIDSFGNLVTDISREILESLEGQNGVVIHAGSAKIDHFNRSYAESEIGEVLAIIGSFNRLEISINQGNAAQVLGLKRGDTITICMP
jgi:S-adenosylmethionine hydrolase